MTQIEVDIHGGILKVMREQLGFEHIDLTVPFYQNIYKAIAAGARIGVAVSRKAVNTSGDEWNTYVSTPINNEEWGKFCVKVI